MLIVVIIRSQRFTRPWPLLKSLLWLPVRYYIIFKMCTVTYEALSCNQPLYLHSLPTPVRNAVQHRPSDKGQ